MSKNEGDTALLEAPEGDPIVEAWLALTLAQGTRSSGETVFPDTLGATLGPEVAARLGLSLAASDTLAAATIEGSTRSLDAARESLGQGALRGFQCVDEIGRGGMGVVWRARQDVLARDIALKTATSTDASETEKFLSEALVTARLEHPNIVPVYDLTRVDDGTGHGGLALAMKLVGGRTWQAMLRETAAAAMARPDLERHLEVFQAVANAIAFAHSRELIHCDIKPANVLVGEFGEVLVVDWGLALDVSPEPSADAIAPHVRAVTSPCGTPTYMSPELARADVSKLGKATDIYLLGAVLFEIVTGRAPHAAPDIIATVMQAASCDGPPWRDGDEVPAGLRAILERAMAREPEARYGAVVELQDALRRFLEHRQSQQIAERAQAELEACQAIAARGTAADRNDLYSRFSETVAAFRQAVALWQGNDAARAGEVQARLDFAAAAIDRDDLGLADAQLSRVEPDDADDAARARTRTLRTRLERGQAAARAARRAARVTRIAIVAAALIIIAGLAVGYVLIDAERQRALDSESLAAERQRLAETRLAELRRLADVKHMATLRERADDLWPATPARVPDLEAWLADADALLSREAAHTAYLAELRAEQGEAAGEDAWRFALVEHQWEHDTLAELVADLAVLRATLRPDVARRLDEARTVYHRTIEAPRAAWDAAIAAVAAEPRYGGLQLTPQLGLVPLGADPDSGLQEFAHLPSGAVPQRGADGRLIIEESSAIVLTLLPGATFTMGAVVPDAQRPAGSANADPDARDIEGPVHEVALDAFFIAKHEMTQGQWQRFTGHNPSAYQPGGANAAHTVDLRHPVEQVGRDESQITLERLGLTLPTEAQWEYAARGGTSTVFFTGDERTTLQGALNIADRYAMEHGGPGSWHYETWLEDGYVVHAPVGRFRPNGFGLHDVAGNVWEWCSDRFAAYTSPTRAGTGEREAAPDAPRVFRGGGFRANFVHARVADRYSLYATDYRAYDVGLRAARLLTSPDAPPAPASRPGL